jgi:hypothetical protein
MWDDPISSFHNVRHEPECVRLVGFPRRADHRPGQQPGNHEDQEQNALLKARELRDATIERPLRHRLDGRYRFQYNNGFGTELSAGLFFIHQLQGADGAVLFDRLIKLHLTDVGRGGRFLRQREIDFSPRSLIGSARTSNRVRRAAP